MLVKAYGVVAADELWTQEKPKYVGVAASPVAAITRMTVAAVSSFRTFRERR